MVKYVKADARLKTSKPVGTEYIDEWYKKAFPTDELGDELEHITFGELYTALKNRKDIYEVIGAYDSTVRERLFVKLAKDFGFTVDEVYGLWTEDRPIESAVKKPDGEPITAIDGNDEPWDKDLEFWYDSKHGIGPGMLPKGVRVLDTYEPDLYTTHIRISRPLTHKEELEYEVFPCDNPNKV